MRRVAPVRGANSSPQPTVIPLRALSAAKLRRWWGKRSLADGVCMAALGRQATFNRMINLLARQLKSSGVVA